MKTIKTATLRLIAAAVLCAALSACSQPVTNSSAFPSYGAAAAAGGTFVAPSIMDY